MHDTINLFDFVPLESNRIRPNDFRAVHFEGPQHEVLHCLATRPFVCITDRNTFPQFEKLRPAERSYPIDVICCSHATRIRLAYQESGGALAARKDQELRSETDGRLIQTRANIDQ